ncbi:DNA alkylation repair protein [Glutamicibacter sp. MNS18]|uniref:DNA alkylation repair protein n=1 Tax=Glutamicibacter sp. MNS18 TaxID=2989817 RepID=UPI002235B7D5|nr:DNA alkylation repair protein [Glutamicibacter sp. MNS18]MCW4464693.1 DNA alkylation repair protein [Glutamicibacter sp. MNS18]
MAWQSTLNPQSTVVEIRAEIESLEDPRMRATNEKHGNDFGVNLTKLRAVAKALKTNQELAGELWRTGDTTLRLLALLICQPKKFSEEQLEQWMRDSTVPKVNDWFINYVVKKSPHLETMRQRWFAQEDTVVAAAGWELTAHQVTKKPEVLDFTGLLDVIEARMAQAPDRLQWAMNNVLATIGINDPDLRPRALQIGHDLQVLADYPTSPGCTSPFAPIWIEEMVRRQQQ